METSFTGNGGDGMNSVRDVSPWQPAAPAGNMEAAIRELQGMVQMLMRENEGHIRTLAAVNQRLVNLERGQQAQPAQPVKVECYQ